MRIIFLLLLAAFTSLGQMYGQRCISQFGLENISASEIERRNRHFEQVESFLTSHPVMDRNPITIPLVFHIVYRNEEENISDEQVLSQLEVLNEDFRKLNIEQEDIPFAFKFRATDMALNFVLADTDPNGQVTTGITRTFTEVNNIGSKFLNNRRSICYNDLGGHDAWCPEQYLNIWVGALESGLGQSSFPELGPLEEDGIRIIPEVVGTIGTVEPPYHLGRTLTHEIGHFFDLYHLWDDCNAEGDGIEDTPPQASSYLNQCPSGAQFTCETLDMYMNFMNYTDDACMSMFTHKQKDRLWAVLNTSRSSFMNEDNCGLVSNISSSSEVPKVQVFPNPSSDFIYINPINSKIDRLVLIDLHGKVCKKLNVQTTNTYALIDITDLLDGVYYLQISNGTQRRSKKIVVQKTNK